MTWDIFLVMILPLLLGGVFKLGFWMGTRHGRRQKLEGSLWTDY